jgi:hypothetical protein
MGYPHSNADSEDQDHRLASCQDLRHECASAYSDNTKPGKYLYLRDKPAISAYPLSHLKVYKLGKSE